MKIRYTLLILSALLFIGCASKPAMPKEKVLEYEKAVDSFEEALYAPEISSQELQKFGDLAVFDFEEYRIDNKRKLVQPITTDRRDFSGKIVNATDKEAAFKITAWYSNRTTTEQPSQIELVIPAGQTGYFIIEDFIILEKDLIAIEDKNTGVSLVNISPSYIYRGTLTEGCAFVYDPDCFSVCTELLKSHSLEFVYDNALSYYDIQRGVRPEFLLIEPVDEIIKNENNLVILKNIENQTF